MLITKKFAMNLLIIIMMDQVIKGLGEFVGQKFTYQKKIKIIDLVLFVYDENQKINTATIQIPHRLEPSYSKHH